MKNKILILLFLLLQGICCVGFAQNPCEPKEPQTPPEEPQLVPGPTSDSVTIQSYQPLDPNEIIGLDGYNAPESTDTLRWVSATQSLAYTIYFENDAELAMAAASKVSITMPLHEKFNYATFGVGSFGFGSYVFAVEGSPSSYQTRIDLRDSMGIFLDVVAGLDIVHNEAFWIFQSIDPATGLPPTDIHLGFLPINDSLHSGEGFVTCTIKPDANDCITGDTVSATASIVFDVNEAIPTNTWVNTIDAVAPTSALTMTPNGADMLTASFAGEDDTGGCGIKQYKLYYSVNSNAYQLYDVYPVGGMPEIPLQSGTEYRFFVLAEDNVGNCEPMKSEPEFTIGTNFVTLAVNVFPQDAGTVTGDGTYSVHDTAQLTTTAADGYHFVNWMNQGVPVSTETPYTVEVTQDQTYTAYFERNAYTLETLASDGSTITVTDLNGNEIPSGSTILYADQLMVRIDTSACYTMSDILLNNVAYVPGDTLTVTGDIVLMTAAEQNVTYVEMEDAVCQGYAYMDYGFTLSEEETDHSGLVERSMTVPSAQTGCDSTITLRLTIHPTATELVEVTACGSYTWNDSVYTESGDYRQTFTATTGCDSVATLHLTIHPADTVEFAETACGSYTWDDEVYTESGDYVQTFTNANGCDSVVTLHLTIYNGDYAEVSVDTCGTEYYWALADTTVSQSGTYYHYIANANSCTDTTVLMLALYPSATTELTAQICEGEVYDLNGFNASTAGDHQLNLQTAHGCDSMVILHLAVGSEAVTQLAATICEGESYNENGFEIIAPAAGVHEYSDTIGRPGTCDSIVVLTLTVNQPTEGDTTAVACGSFDWYGYTNLTESGDYTDVLMNAAGCDSTVTLHLTINVPTEGDTTAVACGSFDWHGYTNLTESGDYTDVLTNAAGCDSTVTLHLTINVPTEGDTTAVACGSFDWHGTTYTSSGSYQSYLTNAAGCDSIVTLHLTVNTTTYGDTTAIACNSFEWHGITYTSSGSYQSYLTNAAGCDSIVTLHLTINHGDYVEVTVDTCGTEFFWEVSGQSYARSDTYYYYSTNANACQDTNVLVLTLHQAAVTELAAQICEGDTYIQNGFNVSEAGDYQQNLQTVFGCDSTVILHLTVDNETVTNLVASICEGEDYVANGFEIIAPEAGIREYIDTIHRQGTCDSIVTLHLTVNSTTYGDTTAIACDSFDWYGTTYTSSGSYQSYLTNANGCDSIVTLHLTVNTTTYGDTTAIACDSFDWHGTTYTTSGSYQSYLTNAAGCDSIVTLHLTVNSVVTESVEVVICENELPYHYVNGEIDTIFEVGTPSVSTVTFTLTTVNGCDSLVALHLTVYTIPETSSIIGDSVICRNQLSAYYYDITDDSYNYQWYKDNILWSENVPVVVLYEQYSGAVNLQMQVHDALGCWSSTSLFVQVQEQTAPDTTIIHRNGTSNILVCHPVTSPYGTVHYQWGYTNRLTSVETLVDGDFNYCRFDIGIDTVTYLYWVETYVEYANDITCANRSYYGYGQNTSVEDYDGNQIRAYIMDNRIILSVNAVHPSPINAALYDVNGRLLLAKDYGFTAGVSDAIPVNLADGIYLLKVVVGNQPYSIKLLNIK